MKTFVSNLGFDTSQLYQCLLDYGVNGDDRLLLFRTDSEDPRGENAVDEIERMLREVDRDISVDVEVLDPDGYGENVATITRHLDGAEGDLIVNLGGGDRAVTVAMTIAATLTEREISHTTLLSDTTRNREEIELPRVPMTLTENQQKSLRRIQEHGPMTIGELASDIDVSDSTASRIVNQLQRYRFVVVEKDGRSKYIKRTPLTTALKL